MNTYFYRARVVKVVDGDTVDVDIDLGFGSWLHKQRLRLYGINAPEVRGPQREAGLITTDWLKERIDGRDIFIETFKAEGSKGKYGRWLANLYTVEAGAAAINLNQQMVTLGLAWKADY